MRIVKKYWYIFLLSGLLLLSLCGCSAKDTGASVNISVNDFTDGEHPRDDVYEAAFKTKSIALDDLNIHFAASVFDETGSPALAEQISASYEALRAFDAESTQPVEVYVVTDTTTGKPVVADSTLFCTTEYIESREYLPFLVSCAFDLDPWWQCVGLSSTIFDDTAASPETLSGLLGDYTSKHTTSYLLSLAPCYFIEEFADEETRDLAELTARALTEYVLSQSDMETYRTNGCDPAYRSAWLDELDISLSLDGMDTPEASHVSALPLSCTDDIPWIIQEQNFQLNLQSVDWMSTADDVYTVLVEFYQGVNQLYAYLEQNAPVFYASLQDRSFRTSVSFFNSDYAKQSWTALHGQQAGVTDRAATLHELVHGLMPIGASDERRWLGEGLATYLSALYIPYDAYPAVVDTLANDSYAAKLSRPLQSLRSEIVNIFEEMTGRDISQIYQMDQAISLIYQASGYAVCLYPEYKNTRTFSFVTESVDDRIGVDSGYAGNELSYAQAMVFTQYLMEKYDLDTLIEAEMDIDAYRALFPDETAFLNEYDRFVSGLNFK